MKRRKRDFGKRGSGKTEIGCKNSTDSEKTDSELLRSERVMPISDITAARAGKARPGVAAMADYS